MRKVLFMLMLALVVVPAASAGNGHGNAKPLPLDQALPLIGAAPTVDAGTVKTVSKDDAVAAMTAPGATTTLLGGYLSPGAAVAASTGCASNVAHASWGTWPYDHTIYVNTYWCVVVGDHITSYSTTVTTDQTLCSRQNVDHFTYSGGVNYTWVTIQSNATWSCPIYGVIPFSVGAWIRTAYNAWGSDAIVGTS